MPRNLARPRAATIAVAALAAPALTVAAAFVAAPAGAATLTPLTVHLKQVTRTVTVSGAKLEAPKVTVTGGRPGVARAITAAVSKHEDARWPPGSPPTRRTRSGPALRCPWSSTTCSAASTGRRTT